jgi:hypothetical protein
MRRNRKRCSGKVLLPHLPRNFLKTKNRFRNGSLHPGSGFSFPAFLPFYIFEK